MSGGSKTQTTTNQTVIPEEVKPLLSDYLQRASDLSKQPGTVYGGQRVADMTDLQKAGMSDMWGQARNSYGGIDAARTGLMGVAAGQGYDQNPYFDATVQKSMGDITRNYQEAIAPQTNANFARAGAFGGSAWQQANERNQRGLGEALGNTSNAMRSGNYQIERQNQMQAYGLLPQVSQAGMGVAKNMYNMGAQGQAQDQALLSAGQQAFMEQQQAPTNQLGILGNAVGVGMGGAGQSTTGANPNYRSPFQTALGLGGMVLGAPQTSILGGLFGMGT